MAALSKSFPIWYNNRSIIKKFQKGSSGVLATGIFLILGTCNMLTLTPLLTSHSYGIKIGSFELWTPAFQLLSFCILLLFFFMNFDTLANIRLDYMDAKRLKGKE